MDQLQPLTNPFLLTSIGHFVISFGHTSMGLQLFSPSSPSSPFYSTPTDPKRKEAVTYRNGWFQGSVFFAVLGLINYRWHKNGNFGADATDKPIAALSAIAYLASALFYKRVKEGAWKPLTLVAILQMWAAIKGGKQ